MKGWLILILVGILISLGCVSAFQGGDGTSGNPYQIGNWSDLNATRNNLTASYILVANLSSSTADYAGLGNNWVPIGNQTAGYKFNGTFNGQNNTISDLIINKPTTDYVGLFSYSVGNIYNVGLLNNSVIGRTFVGGLVGAQYDGMINNCYSVGNVNATLVGNDYVGGLAGFAITIYNSYSAGNVGGYDHVGGLYT